MLFTDEELGIESEFPAAYHAPGTWGWSVQDADELHKHFQTFDACHLPNPYNENQLLKTLSVSFVADRLMNSSQVLGGYREPGKVHAASQEEEEHCLGPVLPSSQAPGCIGKLQKVLNGILHSIPGYEKRHINYLSVMHYPDENAGIGWHKHGEDNGCNTPVLLVATGAVRDFYLGKQVRGREPKEGPDIWWRKPMEHGSLIVLPDEMNYTHWHAILKNTSENRKRFSVPDIPYGPRISINTKCVVPPSVFTLKGKHPRHGVYVSCAGTSRTCGCHRGMDGTIWGNSYRPLDADGHKNAPVAHNENDFRVYAESKMLNAAFRAETIKKLRGKHLLCWCIQDGPKREPFCHARVWLEIVNRKEYGTLRD